MNAVIVINSCDAYSDLWDPFFLCMADYWADCEYKIVLNTETKDYIPRSHIPFNISVHHYKSLGVDAWGARLISTLNDINSEFVIVLYDDFLLDGIVDQKKIADLVDLMSSNSRIGVIYLTKLLDVSKESRPGNELVEVSPRADYRLNSAPAIWRKDLLLKFTAPNDNPWAWEYFGSFRTFSNRSTFLAISDKESDVYPYDYRKGGAIYRGKWVEEVINPIIDRHGLDLDLQKRGTVGSSQFPKRDIKWKILFIKTGFQMIGLRAFYALYRILRNKAVKSLRS